MLKRSSTLPSTSSTKRKETMLWITPSFVSTTWGWEWANCPFSSINPGKFVKFFPLIHLSDNKLTNNEKILKSYPVALLSSYPVLPLAIFTWFWIQKRWYLALFCYILCLHRIFLIFPRLRQLGFFKLPPFILTMVFSFIFPFLEAYRVWIAECWHFLDCEKALLNSLQKIYVD